MEPKMAALYFVWSKTTSFMKKNIQSYMHLENVQVI